MPKTRTREEEREYRREWRARKQAERNAAVGLYVLPGTPELMQALDDKIAALDAQLPKTVRAAVLVDLERLDALTRWPAECALILKTAEILDSPTQKPQHVNAAKTLFDQITTIRTRVDATRPEPVEAPDDEPADDEPWKPALSVVR